MKLVRRLSCLIGMISIPAVAVLAQQVIGGFGNFKIDIDYARFFGNDSLVYIEIYYGVPEAQLTYHPREDGYIGGMNVYATIRQNNEIVEEKSWTVPHVLLDASTLAHGRNIVGLTSFALKPGSYRCEILAHDIHKDERFDTLSFPLEVTAFPTQEVTLSDIQFSSSIRRMEPDAGNVFYKNTLEVMPNASGLYGVAVPILFYYVEAYNLLASSSKTYVTRTAVYDAAGNQVIAHDKTKQRLHETSVEVGSVKVGQLRGGTYTFVFSLQDPETQTAVTRAKRFFVYRLDQDNVEHIAGGAGGALASEFAIMEEAELDREFAQARYIAADQEVRQYREFDRIPSEQERLEGKRTFLYNFWKRRDPEPATPENNYKNEYRERVRHANREFTAGYRQGWESDRGRVYILYGAPDEIERNPSIADALPYETWYYHRLQGGVLFVFVERSGFGDWTLVHSTHRNEIRDDNWTRYIRR